MSRTQNAFDRNVQSLTQKKTRTKKKTKIECKYSKDSSLFPYSSMPYRLDDKKEKKTCWFLCIDHVEKYITRHKLQSNEYVLSTSLQVS